MISLILLIIGFIFLIKGADFLVDGASAIAKKLRISDIIIGLTIVAFGTSVPELIVNLFASVQGNSQIAIGNIIGSNIINIFIILGISSIIYPLFVTKNTIWKEIPFCLFITIILAFLANDSILFQNNKNELSRIDGVIFLTLFIIFIYYVIRLAQKERNKNKKPLELDIKQYSYLKSILLITIGFIILNIGAKWVVDGAVYLASLFGVTESLIALTIVALGTSLPELATSAVAAYRKNTDIAIGNIVGSNIFNILFILGISSLIRPLIFKTVGNIDILIAVLAPLLLFITMFSGRKKYTLERWEGVLFILIYSVYLAFIIIRG